MIETGLFFLLSAALLLRTVFGKRLITSIAAVTTAYLLCQPAKWIGLLGHTLFQSQVAEYAVHLISLTAGAFLFLRYLAETLAEVFGKDTRSVCIFGITPAAYYLFDYVAVVYNDWLYSGNLIVFEFLPFFLSVVFTVFCIVYYRTCEKQADAERKEQIVRITVAEQRKELDAVRRSEKEVRIMRHDMRLLLGNLSACLENGDIAAAVFAGGTAKDSAFAQAAKRKDFAVGEKSLPQKAAVCRRASSFGTEGARLRHPEHPLSDRANGRQLSVYHRKRSVRFAGRYLKKKRAI